MQIVDLLTPERTLLSDSIHSKKRALETLSGLLAEELGLDSTELFDAFIARERLGSTAVGHGVALPHIRAHVMQPIGALMLLKHPLDFHAPDQKPVQLLFAIVVPENATDTHLQILAMLAKNFNHPHFRSQLLHAPNTQALYHLAIQPHADA